MSTGKAIVSRLGAPWAIEALFAKSSDRIGLCLDTAWMLDSGFDPVEIAKKYQKRLCLLYTSPSPRDRTRTRMPSSA